jgi:hypothetical protein
MKKRKKNLCPHGRYQRHPPSTRFPQEARPPAAVRRSPHCRATCAHLDTEIVVKAVASIPVKKTDSDASRVVFVFRNQTAPPAIPDAYRVAAKAPGGVHIWAPPALAKVGREEEEEEEEACLLSAFVFSKLHFAALCYISKWMHVHLVQELLSQCKFVGLMADESTDCAHKANLTVLVTYQKRGKRDCKLLDHRQLGDSKDRSAIMTKMVEVLGTAGLHMAQIAGAAFDGAAVFTGCNNNNNNNNSYSNNSVSTDLQVGEVCVMQ